MRGRGRTDSQPCTASYYRQFSTDIIKSLIPGTEREKMNANIRYNPGIRYGQQAKSKIIFGGQIKRSSILLCVAPHRQLKITFCEFFLKGHVSWDEGGTLPQNKLRPSIRTIIVKENHVGKVVRGNYRQTTKKIV